MTLKEWAKRNGAGINDRYAGGVYGCPIDYSFIRNGGKYNICADFSPSEENCTKCWNQEYRKGMTNADRIRSLDDEKLAEELMCPIRGGVCNADTYEECVEYRRKWLQQEVDEDEE